jgi:hypothetical protein
MADAYRLDQDQALLVFEDGRGRLYESRAAMLDMMDAIANEPPRSTAADRLPEGREFSNYAKGLAVELGITALTKLEDAVDRLGVEVCLSPPMFGRLVAYVGEAIIQARSGDWQMRLATDSKTWEPWVVDAAGRAHAPFGLVFNEFRVGAGKLAHRRGGRSFGSERIAAAAGQSEFALRLPTTPSRNCRVVSCSQR